MEPFLGEIRMFGGNFAPRGWAFCNGQIMAIAQNTALFSLLGTTYGGDGRTTFGLPDLRGRVPMHIGAGPGLSRRELGETGGQETSQLMGPAIGVKPTTEAGVVPVPSLNGLQPLPTMAPYLGVNFIIALEGIYPSRD